MQIELLKSEARPHFDRESWNEGYMRGYVEGYAAGELSSEQAPRDRLLRRLVQVECDLRLGLLDLETPEAMLRAVALLLEDRKQS